ncbi:MAG: hypothetical protein ACFCU2_08775 [Acidimicrobiia bacterium]
MSQEESPVVSTGATTKRAPGLLVIGAGLVVATWVVFGLLAGEWNPSQFWIGLALLVLLSGFNVGGISVSARVERAIGLFFGLAALVGLLAIVRYDSFPSDAWGVIAYVLFLIGATLMFIGARGLSD